MWPPSPPPGPAPKSTIVGGGTPRGVRLASGDVYEGPWFSAPQGFNGVVHLPGGQQYWRDEDGNEHLSTSSVPSNAATEDVRLEPGDDAVALCK